MPEPALPRWLATDVLALATLFTTVSALAAMLVQLIARGRQPGALQLAFYVAAVELGIVIGFTSVRGATAPFVSRHPRVAQLDH